MALVPGTRVGPHEVAGQIGAGGMGEVYRATDTNLKRSVAIKVLAEGLASDPERLARRIEVGPPLSPDGRMVAFISPTSQGEPVIWVRSLDSSSAHALPGSEGATCIFWSPDSQQIGFFKDGNLMKIAVSGGQPQFIANGPFRDGAWSAQRLILVGLPDRPSALHPSGTLMVQRFNLDRLELSGDAVPIADGARGIAHTFSVSANGTLAFMLAAPPESQLVWFDRTGRQLETAGTAAVYRNPAFSRDGRFAAFERSAPSELWMLDLEKRFPTRIPADRAGNRLPLWSPDSRTIVFVSTRDGREGLYERKVGVVSGDTLLLQSDLPMALCSPATPGAINSVTCQREMRKRPLPETGDWRLRGVLLGNLESGCVPNVSLPTFRADRTR